jgi:predicted DNA-binding protein
MPSFSPPLPDQDGAPVAHIARETRRRFRHLPEELQKRQRKARNRYMRDYMRAYRNRQERKSLTLTLSPDRHRHLQNAADTSGRPLAAFIPEAAEAYLQKRYLVPVDIRARLADAITEIRRIGNNINQMAHHANRKRETSRQELREARCLLQRLEETVLRHLTDPPEAS